MKQKTLDVLLENLGQKYSEVLSINLHSGKDEEILDFVEHLILVVIDELGEISRVRKKFLRDKQSLDIATLKKEIVDIFIFVVQGSMALRMNLGEEYTKGMKHNKERFLKVRRTWRTVDENGEQKEAFR